MIDKEKTCVLIGAHPQTSNDSALLSLTIEGIKRQGFKICLVSHSPINLAGRFSKKASIPSLKSFVLPSLT